MKKLFLLLLIPMLAHAGAGLSGGGVGVHSSYLPTPYSQDITLANNKYLKAMESGGTVRGILGMAAGNNIYLGASANGLYIAGSYISFSNAATFASNVSSTKACDTGFTRIALKYCKKNSVSNYDADGSAGACTAVAAPAGANYVRLKMIVIPEAAGSAAVRFATWTAYSDASCTTGIETETGGAYEFTALTAGTMFSGDKINYVDAPVVSGNAYFKCTRDAGAHTLCRAAVVGGFD